jgi:heptaprenylglyceryl phosphate synthase
VKELVLTQLLQRAKEGRKQLAVLIDPDSVTDEAALANTCKLSNEAGVELILVGGSLITNGYV